MQKKGKLRQFLNDFLPNRVFFQQNLKRKLRNSFGIKDHQNGKF